MSEGTNRCPKCNGEMVQGFTCGREGPNRVVSALGVSRRAQRTVRSAAWLKR